MKYQFVWSFVVNSLSEICDSTVPYIAVVLAGSLDAMTINGASAYLKSEKESCASHIHDDFVD